MEKNKIGVLAYQASVMETEYRALREWGGMLNIESGSHPQPAVRPQVDAGEAAPLAPSSLLGGPCACGVDDWAPPRRAVAR